MRSEAAKRQKRTTEFKSSVNTPELLTPLKHYSTQEVLERVPVIIGTAFIVDGKGYVTVFMRCKQFSHSFTFHVDAEVLVSQGVIEKEEKKFYNRDLEKLGFVFNGTLFGSKREGGDIALENRYRIILDKTKDTYIITESLADHWQASHSHRSYIEHYYFGKRDGPSVLREDFSLFSLQEDGTIRRDSNYRLFFFSAFKRSFYSKGGARVRQEPAQLVHSRPIASEARGIAHNVYIKSGTIIGTSKVLMPGEVLPQGKLDWQAEQEFDKTLTVAFAN